MHGCDESQVQSAEVIMNEQEKEIFYALLEKYDSEDGFDCSSLAREDMRVLCKGIAHLPSRYSRPLMSIPQMLPEYVDLMFENHPTVYDVMDIINLCECVQPRHIEKAAAFLLNVTDFWSHYYDHVWNKLLSHPLCTDAVRVKYNLLRGE